MAIKRIALSLVVASSLVAGALVADNQTVNQQSNSEFILIPCTTQELLEESLQQEKSPVSPEKKPGDIGVDDLFFDDMPEFDFDDIDLEDLRSAEASNPQTMPLSVQLKLAALYLRSCKDGAIEHVVNNREAYVYGIIACAALGIAFFIIKKKAQQ